MYITKGVQTVPGLASHAGFWCGKLFPPWAKVKLDTPVTTLLLIHEAETRTAFSHLTHPVFLSPIMFMLRKSTDLMRSIGIGRRWWFQWQGMQGPSLLKQKLERVSRVSSRPNKIKQFHLLRFMLMANGMLKSNVNTHSHKQGRASEQWIKYELFTLNFLNWSPNLVEAKQAETKQNGTANGRIRISLVTHFCLKVENGCNIKFKRVNLFKSNTLFSSGKGTKFVHSWMAHDSRQNAPEYKNKTISGEEDEW